MPFKKIKCILFDFDGVVIDSCEAIESFWKEKANLYDIQCSYEMIKDFVHGRTAHATIETLFNGLSTREKTNLHNSAKQFDVNMNPNLITGFNHFLTRTKNFNILTGIVTSSDNKRVDAILKRNNIPNQFSVIISGSDVRNPKPHPEPYLKAAQLLNIDPEECLVFEDSESGVSSAAEAGMFVVQICSGKHVHKRAGFHISDYTHLYLTANGLHKGDDLICQITC